MAIPNRRPDAKTAGPRLQPQLAGPPPDAPLRSRRMGSIFRWIGTGLGILVLVLILVASWLIESPGFHRYLLRTVQEEASKSLEVPVHLQEFSLHLPALKVDLYGLTVEGAAPYAATPLLQVEHAEAEIRIVSLFGPKWYFNEIHVDRPVVQVLVDKDGRSNLPSFKTSSESSSHTSVFDLGIRHAVLDHGEVFYNNRPAALAADLHQLSYLGSFDSRQRMYSGRLSYANGQLAYGGFRPLEHDLSASFEATPDVFHLSEARIQSASSSIALSGTLHGYSSQVVDARYDVNVDGAQLGRILASASVPSGVVRTQGTLHYQPLPRQPALDGLKV